MSDDRHPSISEQPDGSIVTEAGEGLLRRSARYVKRDQKEAWVVEGDTVYVRPDRWDEVFPGQGQDERL